MFRSKYSSLIGMIISIFVLFGNDRWLDNRARIAQRSSDFQPYMIWIILSGLFICAVLVGLSWLTLFRSERSSPISTIFITVGLIVYIYPVLYQWHPRLISWLPLPYFYFYNTPFAYMGIFIAVLGILHLSYPSER